MLRAQRSHPESKRAGEGELRQPVIEQGLSPLEADPHRHSIDFDKNVAGQIVMKIPAHHRVLERFGGRIQTRSKCRSASEQLLNLLRRSVRDGELEHPGTVTA